MVTMGNDRQMEMMANHTVMTNNDGKLCNGI